MTLAFRDPGHVLVPLRVSGQDVQVYIEPCRTSLSVPREELAGRRETRLRTGQAWSIRRASLAQSLVRQALQGVR